MIILCIKNDKWLDKQWLYIEKKELGKKQRTVWGGKTNAQAIIVKMKPFVQQSDTYPMHLLYLM